MRVYHRDPGDDVDAPPSTPEEQKKRQKMLDEIKKPPKDEPYDEKFWHGVGVQGPQ